MIFMAGPGHGAPGVLGPGLPGRDLLRDLPGQERGRGRAARVLQAVLVSRRHRQPLHAGNARLDPRRRRAGLRPVARLRRGVRQSRPDRRGRRRRRRSRNRAAGDVVAHQQVPQPDSRRRGPADPAPQRLQDQQPDAAGAHQPRGAGEPLQGLRLDAVLRRRLRPREHAPGDGGDAGAVRRGDPADPAGGPRQSGVATRPRWPMIVLRTPRAGPRPAEVDGHKLEGFWRSHQVPLADVKKNPAHLKLLEDWMRSYKPEELFDDERQADSGAAGSWRRPATRRMGANPHANGGLLKKALRMPDFRDYARQGREARADRGREHAARSGAFLRDVMKPNMDELPRLRPGREHLEQAARHLRSQQEALDRRVLSRGRRRRRAGHRRPRHRDAQRAHAGRHAGRLPAHRPARLLLDLRSLRPRHRLDVQPARQVAGDLQPPVVAGRDRLAEPADHLHGLAAGPQRLHAPGSRASSTSS